MAEATIEVVSPVPGVVSSVPVHPGDRVDEGDTLVVVNSMKMEIAVTAESAGAVSAILVEEGQEIEAGAPVAQLSAI